jgi:hypothetical protein
VRDLRTEALSVATRLGDGRNEHWSAFGATNIRVHQVAALADLRSGGRVIEAAAAIPRGDPVRRPRERRAAHCLDVATGYLQWGKRDEAASTLLEADRLAPEEVRCRSVTRQIIADLVRSCPRSSSVPAGLAKLARVTGVAT